MVRFITPYKPYLSGLWVVILLITTLSLIEMPANGVVPVTDSGWSTSATHYCFQMRHLSYLAGILPSGYTLNGREFRQHVYATVTAMSSSGIACLRNKPIPHQFGGNPHVLVKKWRFVYRLTRDRDGLPLPV